MKTYQVTNSSDSGVGSLRAAVNSANAKLGLDTIEIESDVNLNSEIIITDSVEIVGEERYTITQTQSDRLFTIDDSNPNNSIEVTLSTLNLTGGNNDDVGGAIASYEDLTLNHLFIFGNQSRFEGGAIYLAGENTTISESEIEGNTVEPNANSINASGGGVFLLDGALTLADSIVRNNRASFGGGIAADSGQLNIKNSSIESNLGNGIYVNESEIDISQSNIVDNSSQASSGGGLQLESNSSGIITETEISSNSAPFGGGIGIDNSDLVFTDSQITQNSSTKQGGGIYAANNSLIKFDSSTISGNSAPSGGGIAKADDSSSIEVVDSLVENNGTSNITGSEIVFDNSESFVDEQQPSQSDEMVFRFFSNNLGSSFYTADLEEKEYIEANLDNYQLDGESYNSVNPLTGNASPVHRFFNTGTGSHLYTIDETEKDYIEESLDNFDYEGQIFYAFQTQITGSIPMYRFYEPDVGVHHFILDEAEKTALEQNPGEYNHEGIAYYVMPVDLI